MLDSIYTLLYAVHTNTLSDEESWLSQMIWHNVRTCIYKYFVARCIMRKNVYKVVASFPVYIYIYKNQRLNICKLTDLYKHPDLLKRNKKYMWFWNTMRKYVEKKFMSLLDYIWCTSINLFDSKMFFEPFSTCVLPLPIFS